MSWSKKMTRRVWYKLLILFYLVSFVQDGGHDGCFAVTKKLVRIEETVCVVAAPLRNRRKKELSRKKHHVEQGVNEEMLEKCVTKFATRFFVDGGSVECMRRRTLRCDVTSRIKTCTGQRQHTMRFLSLVFYRAAPPAFLPSQQLHNHTTLQSYSGFIGQLSSRLF